MEIPLPFLLADGGRSLGIEGGRRWSIRVMESDSSKKEKEKGDFGKFKSRAASRAHLSSAAACKSGDSMEENRTKRKLWFPEIVFPTRSNKSGCTEARQGRSYYLERERATRALSLYILTTRTETAYLLHVRALANLSQRRASSVFCVRTELYQSK